MKEAFKEYSDDVEIRDMEDDELPQDKVNY